MRRIVGGWEGTWAVKGKGYRLRGDTRDYAQVVSGRGSDGGRLDSEGDSGHREEISA